MTRPARSRGRRRRARSITDGDDLLGRCGGGRPAAPSGPTSSTRRRRAARSCPARGRVPCRRPAFAVGRSRSETVTQSATDPNASIAAPEDGAAGTPRGGAGRASRRRASRRVSAAFGSDTPESPIPCTSMEAAWVRAGRTHGHMRDDGLLGRLRRNMAGTFFTNWRAYDAPFLHEARSDVPQPDAGLRARCRDAAGITASRAVDASPRTSVGVPRAPSSPPALTQLAPCSHALTATAISSADLHAWSTCRRGRRSDLARAAAPRRPPTRRSRRPRARPRGAAASRPTGSSRSGSPGPCPAMSGALPCTGSNTAYSQPMFAPGIRPRPPTSPAQRSLQDVAVEVRAAAARRTPRVPARGGS